MQVKRKRKQKFQKLRRLANKCNKKKSQFGKPSSHRKRLMACVAIANAKGAAEELLCYENVARFDTDSIRIGIDNR